MKHRVATILLAHGSSDPKWMAPFDGLLSHIRSQLDSERVEMAYMELSEPSMEQQVQALAQDGFTHVDILPLFFAAGRHLRVDVPGMLDQLNHNMQQQGLATEVVLHPPIGLEPEVANAIRDIVVRQVTDKESAAS